MKKIFRLVSPLIFGTVLATPVLASAQSGINTTYIQGYATSIITIINGILVPTLISIAFIVFLWGIYKYFIQGADNEKDRESGRTFALYGIIGFVILFSLWGIVQIFMGTLGLTATNVPSMPTFGNVTGSTGTGAYTGTTGTGTGTGTIGGGVSSAQLQQLYTSYNSACAQDSSSITCTNAYTSYVNAARNSGYPLNGSCASQPGGSCPFGYSCSSSNYCISNNSASNGGQNSTCDSTHPCNTGLTCVDSMCTSGVSGGIDTTCEAPSDCDAGLECVGGLCKGGIDATCEAPSDCGATLECVGGICKGGSSATCEAPSDCGAGFECVGGVCTASSDTSGTCTPEGMTCQTLNGSWGLCDASGECEVDTSNVGDNCAGADGNGSGTCQTSCDSNSTEDGMCGSNLDCCVFDSSTIVD